MRSVRGIRAPIPGGTVIGRKMGAGGLGPPQPISLPDLMNQVTAGGTGSGLTPGVQAGSGLSSIADKTILSNISGGSAVPVGNTLTAIFDDILSTTQNNLIFRGASTWGAGTLTALIDAAIGSTQGDILYRNASAWVVLAPGTAGQVLQTGGAAANPSWVTGSGGTVTNIATTGNIDGGPITTTGTIGLKSIADGGIISNISGGSARPVDNTMSAILDHVFSSTQGSVLYRGASLWAALGPGTSGQALITGGAAANPSWGSVGSGAGGALALLGTVTANNTATTLQITGLPDQQQYMVTFNCILPATNAATITFQFLSGAGPTLENTANTYAYGWNLAGNTFASTGGSDGNTGSPFPPSAVAFSNSTTGIGRGGSGHMYIFHDGNHNYTITGQIGAAASDGHHYITNFNIQFNHSVTITGIRLTTSAGNINSGSMSVYSLGN